MCNNIETTTMAMNLNWVRGMSQLIVDLLCCIQLYIEIELIEWNKLLQGVNRMGTTDLIIMMMELSHYVRLRWESMMYNGIWIVSRITKRVFLSRSFNFKLNCTVYNKELLSEWHCRESSVKVYIGMFSEQNYHINNQEMIVWESRNDC